MFFSGTAQEGKPYDRYLRGTLNNDILFFTDQNDRYFSNGVAFEYSAPFLQRSPLNILLVGGRSEKRKAFSLVVTQNLYTPDELYEEDIVQGDRPYASYLLFENKGIVVDPEKLTRIESSYGLGVLGPIAGGGFMQNWIHSLTPNSDSVYGWANQIANDFLVTYNLKAEKGILNYSPFALNLYGEAMAGTLFNYGAVGAFAQIGLFEPYFKTPFNMPESRAFQLYAYGGLEARYMLYDATLQGGVFNNNSVYTIPADKIHRERFIVTIGARLIYKRLEVDFSMIQSTEEFYGSDPHAWGNLTFGYRF